MTSTHEYVSSRRAPGPADGSAAAMTRAWRTAVRRNRAIAALLGFEALSLAVVSTLHLSHTLGGGSKPFNPTAAGIAEALIGIALVSAVVAVLRDTPGGRRVAPAATAFAVVGFLVGLAFTLQGGDTVDLAYHAVLLPLLVFTLVALLRRDAGPGPGSSSPPGCNTTSATASRSDSVAR